MWLQKHRFRTWGPKLFPHSTPLLLLLFNFYLLLCLQNIALLSFTARFMKQPLKKLSCTHASNPIFNMTANLLTKKYSLVSESCLSHAAHLYLLTPLSLQHRSFCYLTSCSTVDVPTPQFFSSSRTPIFKEAVPTVIDSPQRTLLTTSPPPKHVLYEVLLTTH